MFVEYELVSVFLVHMSLGQKKEKENLGSLEVLLGNGIVDGPV